MAYLFTYFTSFGKQDAEAIWFSVSKDGLHWTDIGSDAPVLKSNVGTHGIRDPFPVYDKINDKYYIIGTDLETSDSKVWTYCSKRGSRSLLVWESKDLINWSNARLVEVGVPGAGNVWAPECIWCEEKKSWFVFFASNVKEKRFKKRKQMIYGTFTKDFKSFTPAFKFMEGKTDLIDTNIAYANGKYYRFTKDETNKKILIDYCNTLLEDDNNKYQKISSEILDNFIGLEGPETYYLREQNKWCLIADEYRGHTGYIPFTTDDFSTGKFTQLKPDEFNFGKQVKRHGGIIEISDEKYEETIKFFGIA